MNNSTKISILTIVITLTLFFSVPYLVTYLDNYVQNLTISATLVINTSVLIIVILKYKLLEEHLIRFVHNLKDGLLFTFIAIFLLSIINFINIHWLKAPIWVPEKEVLSHYALFSPIIICAYSFSYSCLFLLTFKAMTDRFKINKNERLIIFISGAAFGLFVATSFFSVSSHAFIPYFIYYFAISLVTSYIYNQTNNLISMMLAYGIVLGYIILF